MQNETVDAIQNLYYPATDLYYEYDKNEIVTDVNEVVNGTNITAPRYQPKIVIPDGIRRVAQIDINSKVILCVYKYQCIVLN